jgi:3,4-dihydroxy 2-butanone 4-phosphate synthase / GTP cyclohydrolase II
MSFSPVVEILEDIKQGKMVIVCDDEDRENEGDLTMAAELVTPEAINFMATRGRGLICLPMNPELIDRLRIPEIQKHNAPRMDTAFTASIDAADGITTGICAHDRARTIRVAADPESGPEDLVMPGHIFPLRARPGGVIERRGQTEAAVDLARLACLGPAGAICEVMKDDGTMARVPDLEGFSERHGIKMVTVEQIVEYRNNHDRRLRRVGEVRLPTRFGTFRARAYEDEGVGAVHLALLAGEPEALDSPLLHIHSACPLGDIFGSQTCGCGTRLRASMKRAQREGEGIVLYLGYRVEGRLVRAAKMQHLHGLEPERPEANHRHVAARILEDFGVRRAWLATAEGAAEVVERRGGELEVVEYLRG